MRFLASLHPKHLYRSLRPYPRPRIRRDDVPDVEDFHWSVGTETRSIWCEDKDTGQTLFVVTPPRTLREALLIGFMAGRADGWKDRDFYGPDDLIKQIYGADMAHYMVTGYWPDEEIDPSGDDPDGPDAVDDLPEQTVTDDRPIRGQRGRLALRAED